MQRIRERFWWQAWIKPYYLIQAPFDRVLRIDADCVIVNSLEDAFDSLKKRPLVVRDATTVVTENDPRLYEHLPLPCNAMTQGINVNSSVVGLCKIRDRDLLSAWAWSAQWSAMHPHHQSLIAWANQGLLLWALHRTGMTCHIRGDLKYNGPVFQQPGLLAAAVDRGFNMLEEFRARFPENVILHFLGPHKLSRQLGNRSQQGQFCVMSLGAGLLLKAALTAFRI